jgi:hypothetical protein
MANGARPVLVVDDDAQCVQCGYNLRTQRRDGRCPECDTPVAESLRLWSLRHDWNRPLVNSPLIWVCAMQEGVWLLVAAYTLTLLAALGWIWELDDHIPILLVGLAAVGWYVGCAGLFRVSEREPGSSSRLIWYGTVLRGLAVFWALVPLIFASDAALPPRAARAHVAMVMASVSGLTCFLLFHRLSRLAARGRWRGLQAHAMFWALALPVALLLPEARYLASLGGHIRDSFTWILLPAGHISEVLDDLPFPWRQYRLIPLVPIFGVPLLLLHSAAMLWHSTREGLRADSLEADVD